MTSLEIFINAHPSWGYIIAFLGMLVEGEGVFLTAGILAEQGLLRWSVLITASFAGIMAGDLLLYALGWYSETSSVGRWFKRKLIKSHRWLDGTFIAHYQRIAVVSKFIYFVNRITPFIAGWHRIPLRAFIRIHFFAASIWLTTMVLISQPLTLIVNLVGVRWVIERIEFVFIGLALLAIAIEMGFRKIFAKKIAERSGR